MSHSLLRECHLICPGEQQADSQSPLLLVAFVRFLLKLIPKKANNIYINITSLFTNTRFILAPSDM